jgi:hypothetical protein
MHNPITDVATDFPPECAALYPDGFRYPVGYLAPSNRVVDTSIVEPFNPLLRPYVVRDRKGEPMVDPHAPVAVRRLLRDQDSNLLSAIRFLELGGPPDPSMQETYSCEDRLSQAETLSEAGHHASAISMVRALPPPFQQTASALRTLAGSLKALGVYEEALIKVKRLILNEEITEYARDLARIEEANLLVLLGRCADAEKIIRDGRATFRSFYTYYGVRAALALLSGDDLFARQLIARAGRIEDYHSFKLLWEPSLRPLWAFIRHEFLDEENQPLLYRLNSETRRTSHRVQGALLMNDLIGAGMHMEGVILSRITDWSTAYEAVLCLFGLGEFELIDAVCGFLPGSRHAALKLARAVAQSRLTPGSHSAEELERLFEEAGSSARNRDHFNKLAAVLSDGQKDDVPDPGETLLADIGDKWGAQGRERFRVVHVRDEGYSAVGFMEDRKRLGQSTMIHVITLLRRKRFVLAQPKKLRNGWSRSSEQTRICRRTDFAGDVGTSISTGGAA